MKLKSYVVDKDGKFRVNELVDHVKPYWLTLHNTQLNPDDPEQVTMAANAAAAPQPMNVTDEGAFEGALLTCQRADEMTVELLDTVRKIGITARPCHVDTIFGQNPIAGGEGLNPFVLSESIWLDRAESLLLKCTDISGGTNNIRPVIHGQRIFAERARQPGIDAYIRKMNALRRRVLPYICPIDEDPELDADEQNREILLTQDGIGHFDVRKIMYHSEHNFKFKILDDGGQELTRDWVHCDAGAGDATFPYMLYGQWRIRAGGVVRFFFQNLNAQAANQLYVTLSGSLILV